MVFFFISGFKIPHGHGSVSISCWQLGNLASFMTWSTIAHEYELPCARKKLFYWPRPIYCFYWSWFILPLTNRPYSGLQHQAQFGLNPALGILARKSRQWSNGSSLLMGHTLALGQYTLWPWPMYKHSTYWSMTSICEDNRQTGANRTVLIEKLKVYEYDWVIIFPHGFAKALNIQCVYCEL